MMDRPLTRRSWLKTTGAAGGASLIAGCGGGPGDGTPTGTPPEETDAQFVTSEFNTIQHNTYNVYDRLRWPNQSPAYLFGDLWDTSEAGGDDPLVVSDQGTFKGVLAEDWERDGDILAVNLRDDMTWHNGDPVTAQHVVDTWTLDKLADDRKWASGAWVDCWVEDDHTAVAQLGNDANDYSVYGFAGGTDVSHHPEVWGRFLPDDGTRGKAAYEALPSFEKTTLQGNLLSYTVRGRYDPEDPEGTVLGWGLWKMKRHGNREMVFELHEDHPFADRVNYPEVKFVEYTTNQARYQAMLGGDFSGIDLVVTETVWDQLPDTTERYLYNRRLGHGLAINYDRFPDRRVRQAIAYAIDRPQVVENSGLPDPLVTPHTFDSALFDEPAPLASERSSRDTHDNLFGEGFVDQLTHYNTDPETATELLEEAGYSLDDGKWYTPDDERFAITIKVPPTWTEFVNMVQTQVQHLSDFGIDAEFMTEELVVYYGNTMVQADYDMAHWWTGGAAPVPWFAYDTIFNSLQTVADSHKHPKEYENVPMPVGDPDGTEAVNWDEAHKELATTRWGSDRHQELSRLLCWVYNQMLPVYCLNEVNGMATLDRTNWHAPDREDENARIFFPLSHMGGKKGYISSLG